MSSIRYNRVRGCRAGDHPGGGDGSGIDHGIARPAGAGFETDGVEGVAGWLDADPLQDLGAGVVFKRQSVDERFGNGLDGERLPRVADLVNVASGGDQANAEPIRIGLGQFGDISGNFTLAQAAVTGVDFLEVIQHR